MFAGQRSQGVALRSLAGEAFLPGNRPLGAGIRRSPVHRREPQLGDTRGRTGQMGGNVRAHGPLAEVGEFLATGPRGWRFKRPDVLGAHYRSKPAQVTGLDAGFV